MHWIGFLLFNSSNRFSCAKNLYTMSLSLCGLWTEAVGTEHEQMNKKYSPDLTSNCSKIFLMCLKQPSAMSQSSSKLRPLNSGCGALEKKDMKGKCSWIRDTSFFSPGLHCTLLRNSSQRASTWGMEQKVIKAFNVISYFTKELLPTSQHGAVSHWSIQSDLLFHWGTLPNEPVPEAWNSESLKHSKWSVISLRNSSQQASTWDMEQWIIKAFTVISYFTEELLPTSQHLRHETVSH